MTIAAPDRDKILDAWKKADEEQAFWSSRYGELLERYPDRFVAVVNGAVVAADPDIERLIRMIEGQGLELTEVWIRFVTTNPRGLML